MSSQRKDKRKPSSSGAQMVMSPHQMSAQQMSQMWPAMQLFPWNAMMQMGNPANMSSACAATNTKGSPEMNNKNPWDTSDSGSSDFEAPSRKKRRVKSTLVDGEKKRGPGRPKKEETLMKEADLKVVLDYPQLKGKDEIAFQAMEECKSCCLWKGRVALQPCGHALYCFSCMEKFRETAIKLQRPGKCLSDNCYEIVLTWFKLYNISP